MSTIGIIDVLLRADASKFKKGTHEAGHSMHKLGEAFKKISEIAAGFLSGEAILGTLKELKSGVEEAFDSIEKIAQASQSIGISTRALSSLEAVSQQMGVSSGTATQAIVRMESKLGTLSVTASATKTALQSYGVNIKKLASESPQKALLDVAQAIHKSGSAMQRATIATAIYGKSGLVLLPILAKGKAGLLSMEAAVRKTGMSFNAVHAARVQQATEAVKELKQVFQGLAIQIAIQVSPYVTALATYLKDVATSGGTMGQKVFTAFSYVIKGVSYFADVLQGVKFAFHVLQVTAQIAATSLVMGFEIAIEAAKALKDALTGNWGGVRRHFDQIGYLARTNTQMAIQSIDKLRKEAHKPWAHTAAEKFLKKIKEQANINAYKQLKQNALPGGAAAGGEAAANLKRLGAIDRLIAGLKQQAATIGMNKTQIVLYKLEQLGANKADIAAAKAMEAKISALKRQAKATNDVKKEMKSLHEQIATFGKSAAQKKIFDLKQEGASPADIAKLEKLQAVLAKLQASKKHPHIASHIASHVSRGGVSMIDAGGAGFAQYQASLASDKNLRNASPAAQMAKQTKHLAEIAQNSKKQAKNSDSQVNYLKKISSQTATVVTLGGA